MCVDLPSASRIPTVFVDGALRAGREVHQAHFDFSKGPEPVHGTGGRSVVGERDSLVIAQGGQRLDHPVVPVPARWDHPDFDGETVDKLLDPLT